MLVFRLNILAGLCLLALFERESMDRTTVIQQIIEKLGAKHYLEIGVDKGTNFFPIRVKHKVAVDPAFRFRLKHRLLGGLKNPSNITAQYNEVTSDEYFEGLKGDERFDVAFVDGLHTHEQSLRDVENTLDILNDHGVIIMHDCNPDHPAAAHPATSVEEMYDINPPGWNRMWCGDVWKAICSLRSKRNDLNVFVLDCDFGLGIVHRGTPDSSLSLTSEEIMKMNYDDLERDRELLLNIKPESYFETFLESL